MATLKAAGDTRIPPEDQIAILLAEYSAREDEKNSLVHGIGNLLAIGVALLIGLFALIFDSGQPGLWLIIPPAFLVLLAVELDRQSSILYQSMYIGLLEERLNEIAGLPLLQWERLGSLYHTKMFKSRIRNAVTGTKVWNFSLVMQAGYALAALAIFLIPLRQSAEWLYSDFESPLQPYAAAIFYIVAHIVWLLVILAIRFLNEPRLRRTLEVNLRASLYLKPDENFRNDSEHADSE